MRATFVLVAHSLRRIRGVLAGIGLLLTAFEFLLTQVAAYLHRTNAFNQLSQILPDFVRAIAGPSLLGFMSFGGVVAFGYFHPMVIAASVGLMIAIATEPAAEVESRFVDLTLARPIARVSVIVRTALTFLIVATALLAVMTFSTWVGLTCCAPADAALPSSTMIASLAVGLGAVMICWAGVTLAIASAARRRAVAGAVAAVSAIAAFLLDYIGRIWEPSQRVSVLSPFHYFEPMGLMMGGSLSSRDVSVLAAIAGAGVLIAAIVYSRRDI